jgi:hypothetical protein
MSQLPLVAMRPFLKVPWLLVEDFSSRQETGDMQRANPFLLGRHLNCGVLIRRRTPQASDTADGVLGEALCRAVSS